MEKTVLLKSTPTWAPVRANSVANQIVIQVVPRIKAVVVSVVDTNGPPRPFVIFAERVVRARFLAEVLEHVAPAVEVAAPV